jgi:Fe-Mn family superoxide dismutase
MNPSIDRRKFLASAAAAAAAAAPVLACHTPSKVAAASAAIGGTVPIGGKAADPYSLPALPYAHEALEPAIDTETMRIHHGKHHQAYITNLNAAVTEVPVPDSVDELIARIPTLPADKQTVVRNNGGGHSNHSLFWSILAPKGKGGELSKELVAAIERDLGGLAAAKEAVNKAGLGRFGSGWAWIIVSAEKKLVITSTPNQDSPLMGAKFCEKPGTPILGVDVWEHAYYLHYQNRRADYLKAFWDVVNWAEVSKRFAAAMA